MSELANGTALPQEQAPSQPIAPPPPSTVDLVSRLTGEAPAKTDEAVAAEDNAEAGAEKAPKREDPRRKLNSQFAALTRKEKALRDRERALNEFQQLQDLKQQDVLAFLEKQGISTDQVVAQMIAKVDAARAETPEQKAERIASEKIAAWEKAQAEKQAAAEKDADDQRVAAHRQSLAQQIYADPEFELLKAHGAADDVFQLIAVTYEDEATRPTIMQADGKIDVRKAARAVENYYFEEAKRLLQAPKLRAVLEGHKAADGGAGAPSLERLLERSASSSTEKPTRPARQFSEPAITERLVHGQVREVAAPIGQHVIPSLNSNTAGGGSARAPRQRDSGELTDHLVQLVRAGAVRR